MKYERRKYFRMYRKLGLPFMVAQRLAKLKSRAATTSYEVETELVKEGFKVVAVTYCDCCGPEVLRLVKGEKAWDLGYWTLLPL